MTINIELDLNFNGTSADISKKYHLINKVNLEKVTKEEIGKIISTRMNIMATIGNILCLTYSPESKGSFETEFTYPPIIVPSSGRPDAVFTSLRSNIVEKSINDLSVFERAINNIAPPAYSPFRIENGRRVYIIVHELEYKSYFSHWKKWKNDVIATYKSNAASLINNLSVVSYKFGDVKNPKITWTGLGASRLAALLLAHNLTAKLGDNKRMFWIMDDDVIHISGLDKLSSIEEQARNGDLCAWGFQGAASRTEVRELSKAIRNSDKASGKGFGKPSLYSTLHQAMLFDVTKLKSRRFSPSFIKSRADPSLMAYLQSEEIKFGIIKTCKVFKGQYIFDGSKTQKRNSDEDSLRA